MGSTVRSLLPPFDVTPRLSGRDPNRKRGESEKNTSSRDFFSSDRKRRFFGAPTLHPPVCPLLHYITLRDRRGGGGGAHKVSPGTNTFSTKFAKNIKNTGILKYKTLRAMTVQLRKVPFCQKKNYEFHIGIPSS